MFSSDVYIAAHRPGGLGEGNYSAMAPLLGKQVSPSRELMPSVWCCFITVSALSFSTVFTLFASRLPRPGLWARVRADMSDGESERANLIWLRFD